MNPIPSLATAFAAPLIACTPTSPDRSGAPLHAGERMLPQLARGEAVHACALRAAMEAAFGGSDAQGLSGRERSLRSMRDRPDGSGRRCAPALAVRPFQKPRREGGVPRPPSPPLLPNSRACCPKRPKRFVGTTSPMAAAVAITGLSAMSGTRRDARSTSGCAARPRAKVRPASGATPPRASTAISSTSSA